MLTQNILTQPTFDLIDWSILSYNSTDKILFCQSNQVFRFDKCKGTITPRSRILREDCQESKYVKNVISATIDAGFVGKLVFKIEFTENFIYELDSIVVDGFINQIDIIKLNNTFQKQIKNSVQIDLNPFPNNYYSGTNQTELEPDVFFTSGNIPIEINNQDFMKGFYLGNSEKERFEGEIKLDNGVKDEVKTKTNTKLKYQNFIGIGFEDTSIDQKPKIIFENSSVIKKYKFLKKIKGVFIEIFLCNYNTDKIIKENKIINQKHLLGKIGVIEKVNTLGLNLLTFETDGHSFITGYITDDEIIQENIIKK